MKTKKKAASIISRFEGAEGKRRLVEAMLRQPIVAANRNVADAFIKAGRLVTAKQGESFIKQDASDNDIYFIVAGRTEVTVKGHHVAFRDAGTFVGEMAATDHGARRSATVTALEECVLLSITEERFSKLAEKDSFPWRFKTEPSASHSRFLNR